MLNMYLRKETRNGKPGVAYYADCQLTVEKCFNSNPSRPDKRNKYVMYNCFKYFAIWA